MAEKVFWHNVSSEEVIKLLYSDAEKGLAEREVKKRQKKFGKNSLPEEKPLSRLTILFEQFRSPLIYILVLAGFVTLFLREYTDTIVIFGAVFLNTIVGYFQENKAVRALQELKKIVKYESQVIRDGNTKVVNSSELVPGDIFIMGPGAKVPADGRIIESYNLKVNEMALTGEWVAAKKERDVLTKEVSLADRDNMVYMGTLVEDGKGKGVVIATGPQTEIGKVAEMVKETKEEKTPYQKKLASFSKIIGGVIAAISFFIFLEGILTGNEFSEMFTIAVAIAVAAIPEGLPVAMTVILALGMQRILKKGGLVRKLVAAETLGSTSIIATDKTATLTQGKIQVTKMLVRKEKNLIPKIAVLCNEAFVENPSASKDKWKLRGRPTDKALLSFGMESGFLKTELEKELPEIDESPFDNKKKFIATLHRLNEKTNILFVAGAPERILAMSEMEEKEKEKWEKEIEKTASKGFRTLAFALLETSEKEINDSFFSSEKPVLDFVAILGLSDPLRKEAKEAIRVCRRAGMKPIIVTGDHKLTARAIAEELGFKIKDENILEGKDLDRLSDKEFEKIISKVQIYARVEPKHKMKIIEVWQQKGEVVAMTGDGINDAPALKKADIGLALGSGTEVAKETSDLILLNDSFSVVVAAIEEGRAILDNIRKVITYLLSDSFSEIILVGGALLAGFPLPILPAQILWVNLIEDGLPDIALAFEPKEKDLMKQKPRGHDAPLLTREMKVIIFIIGFFTDVLLLGLFFWLWNQNHDISYIRTMIFACLTIDSLFYVFSCKSLRRNLWHINPLSNKFLVFSWFVGLIALISALYVPLFQNLLKTVPIGLNEWLIILTLGLIKLILIEVTKWFFIVKNKIK